MTTPDKKKAVRALRKADAERIAAELKERMDQRNPPGMQVGAAIPGSKLLRDYCASCGEAIRVVCVNHRNLCRVCTTDRGPSGGQLDPAVFHDRTYHGEGPCGEE